MKRENTDPGRQGACRDFLSGCGKKKETVRCQPKKHVEGDLPAGIRTAEIMIPQKSFNRRYICIDGGDHAT